MIFTGCAKSKVSSVSNNSSVQNVNQDDKTTSKIEEPEIKINPEIEKLNKVLLSMTDRCKDAIPNGNPEEFLADLHKVLALEAAFPQDDISLYYLIDKTHTVGSDYEPTHLRKLVKNDDYIIKSARRKRQNQVFFELPKWRFVGIHRWFSRLCREIGETQGESVTNLFPGSELICDLNNKPRVVKVTSK